MDRRVTPPKRVTSPTWDPPPSRKQNLSCMCWLQFQTRLRKDATAGGKREINSGSDS